MSQYDLITFVAGLNHIEYRFEKLNENEMIYWNANGIITPVGTWNQLRRHRLSSGTPFVYSAITGRCLGDVSELQGNLYIRRNYGNKCLEP
jgi:hypothetical protein